MKLAALLLFLATSAIAQNRVEITGETGLPGSAKRQVNVTADGKLEVQASGLVGTLSISSVTVSTGSITAFQGGQWTLSSSSSVARQDGVYTVTPGTGTFQVAGSFNSGSYTVTPGTGAFSVQGSTVIIDSRFKRVLKAEPNLGEEMRIDDISAGDLYHGMAPDSTATASATWDVVRFYRSATGVINRIRMRAGVAWDNRTSGW